VRSSEQDASAAECLVEYGLRFGRGPACLAAEVDDACGSRDEVVAPDFPLDGPKPKVHGLSSGQRNDLGADACVGVLDFELDDTLAMGSHNTLEHDRVPGYEPILSESGVPLRRRLERGELIPFGSSTVSSCQ
jgi:hypothetical protein